MGDWGPAFQSQSVSWQWESINIHPVQPPARKIRNCMPSIPAIRRYFPSLNCHRESLALASSGFQFFARLRARHVRL
jgi:hypothetical protein